MFEKIYNIIYFMIMDVEEILEKEIRTYASCRI